MEGEGGGGGGGEMELIVQHNTIPRTRKTIRPTFLRDCANFIIYMT